MAASYYSWELTQLSKIWLELCVNFAYWCFTGTPTDLGTKILIDHTSAWGKHCCDCYVAVTEATHASTNRKMLSSFILFDMSSVFDGIS